MTPPSSSATSASSASASRAPDSCAGSGPDQACRCILSRPREVNGAIDTTWVWCARFGLAQPQEHDRRLVLGLEAGEHDDLRLLQVGVGDVERRGDHVRGEEGGLLGGVRPRPEVDVVGAERDPGELAVGVGVLGGQPPAGEHPDRALGRREAASRDREGLGPRRRAVLAGLLVAHQRRGEPVALPVVAEREAALVAVPLLVDLGVVAGQPAGDLAAAVVGAQRAAGGAVLAHRRRRDEVERPRAEAVRRRGQRADRADLDRVAREVGLERLLLVDAHLLQRAPLDQRDERVAGDLLGEAGAPGAEHAALAVEQHLRGDVDRLGEGALGLGEP